MNWKQITLTILGLILVLFGINDPMLLIFPMWIFYYLLLIFTWYILLRKIKYSKKEVFLITGLLGVFTEEGGQVFLRILSSPIEGFLYAIIIMFVYGLFPMLAYLLCEERFKNKQRNLFLRYGFAMGNLWDISVTYFESDLVDS